MCRGRRVFPVPPGSGGCVTVSGSPQEAQFPQFLTLCLEICNFPPLKAWCHRRGVQLTPCEPQVEPGVTHKSSSHRFQILNVTNFRDNLVLLTICNDHSEVTKGISMARAQTHKKQGKNMEMASQLQDWSSGCQALCWNYSDW